MTQVLTMESGPNNASSKLLDLNGVFYVMAVDNHAEVVAERAADDSVAKVYLRSIPSLAMRIAILRTASNVYREPAGVFRSAVIEFDRTALLVIPKDGYTYGIALLKEYVTPALRDEVQSILTTA
jgi:hypothetical protein